MTPDNFTNAMDSQILWKKKKITAAASPCPAAALPRKGCDLSCLLLFELVLHYEYHK